VVRDALLRQVCLPPRQGVATLTGIHSAQVLLPVTLCASSKKRLRCSISDFCLCLVRIFCLAGVRRFTYDTMRLGHYSLLLALAVALAAGQSFNYGPVLVCLLLQRIKSKF